MKSYARSNTQGTKNPYQPSAFGHRYRHRQTYADADDHTWEGSHG